MLDLNICLPLKTYEVPSLVLKSVSIRALPHSELSPGAAAPPLAGLAESQITPLGSAAGVGLALTDKI
jgi:hypothetical protein